jgi:hydrogenase maturation protease
MTAIAIHPERPMTRHATVDVLVCGNADRGDDGAPVAAADLLDWLLASPAHVRIVGDLDVTHLCSIPEDDGVVIVDAATGLEPGTIATLPLDAAGSGAADVQPRSSHSLPIPEVVAIANTLRGRPLDGRIVAIGGTRFGLGEPLSDPVARAIPQLALDVWRAVAAVHLTGAADDDAHPGDA